MKTKLIIFLLALISTTAFSAKTYDLTITVYSLGEKKPLIGFRVACIESKKYTGEGVTDENGTVTFHGISEKYLGFKVFDSSGVYQEKVLCCYNPSKESEEKEIHLSWTKEKETEFFETIDNNYISNVSGIIEQTTIGELLPKGNEITGFQPATHHEGIDAFYRHLGQTLKYPASCRDKNIEGAVHLSFLVQADGQVSHVKIIKGIVDEMDQEAIRAMRYVGSWNPATINDTPIVVKVIS
ncbi:MAG: TonB family protein, partial [Urechidicola sp.]